MPLLSCQMFTLYLPPTIVVSYRGIEDSIRHHTTLWTGSSLGNYRLGAETSLLHFVSVIFGGDQKGVWSGGFGQRGGSFSGGVTAGRSERHWFLHWIPHFGGRVTVEFRSAVGYVFSWTCWLCQGRDLRTGVTHVAGWFGQSGYSGGCQITAERSASTPSFGGQ